MSAIVKLRLRVFRNFQQFMSIRPISNYPTSFSKNAEIKKVEGKFNLSNLLSISRDSFTREWHVL